ncbi:unnamed protein product [Peniophora sp. CBMAI 1063]|nr:unnamed protein product [Peniophora sp. CBMAI 1063]
MQRIQSAPVLGSPASSFAQAIRAPMKRTKTSVDFLVTTKLAPSSPALRRTPTSSRLDREDAFSLGGFFPSSSREQEQEFDWVRYGVEGEDSADPSRSEIVDEDEDVDRTGLDAVIRAEDKLGVLSVFLVPTAHPSYSARIHDADDERLYSPYSDESCNEESLHLAFAQRSRSRSRLEDAKDVAPGSLFLDPSDGVGIRDGGHGWGLSALAGVF